MIVMHNRIPATMCARNIPHPNRTSHRMLNPTSRHPPSGERATLRPNGQSENWASLNAWIPKGMPMIVMQISRPDSA